MLKVCLSILVIILLAACETSDPGCLDTIAANYDVFAVSECDDCCVYPSVSLSTRFRFDTLDNFSFNTLYEYVGFDSISVSEFQMIFSDFSFYEANVPYNVIDTIEGIQPLVYDEFVLIDQANRNEAIGQTNYLKLIDSVSFTAGLVPEILDRLQPITEVEETSNFANVIEEMYVDSIQTLFQARIELTLDDSIRVIEIEEIPIVDLGFMMEEELKSGISWTVPIYVDIRQLVDGIYPDQSTEMMTETIKNNIPLSISKR